MSEEIYNPIKSLKIENTQYDFDLKEEVFKNLLLNYCYPIGTIYETTNVDFNPNTAIGGTWEQIKGKFLLATDYDMQSGSTFGNYLPGSSGGAATVTLTAAQSGIPAHKHGVGTLSVGPNGHKLRASEFKIGTSSATRNSPLSTAALGNSTFTDSHTISGSVANNTATNASSAHENMPPYITVCVWKRTA